MTERSPPLPLCLVLRPVRETIRRGADKERGRREIISEAISRPSARPSVLMARGLEAVPSVSAFCSPQLSSVDCDRLKRRLMIWRERDDCAFVLPLGENGKRSREGANRLETMTMRGRQLCAPKCKRRSTGGGREDGWMEGREGGTEAGSMRVEHVLRECSYECSMMSSPFYPPSS